MRNSKGIAMDEKYVIDSFAWIEYFLGTKKGEKVAQYIASKNAITPTIVIAELSAKYSKDGKDFSDKLKFIKFNTSIAILNDEIAEFSGRIRTKERKKKSTFGMADAIIYATALKLKAKIVTGDPHFNDIGEVILI